MSPVKMGTRTLKILLFLTTFRVGIFMVFTKAELQTCSDDTTVQKCCLLCDDMDSCNATCPQGYVQKYIPCSDATESSTRGTTLKPSLTTQASMQSTQPPNLTTPGNVSTSNMSGPICVKCDSDEFFNDNSTNCEPCNSACNGCRGPSDLDCDNCKYKYNNNCVPVCPHGFQPGNVTYSKDGNTTLCEAVEPGPEDDNKIMVYIGAGVGAAVLIIIVVVVVVCIIRYKRTSSMETERRQSKSTVRGTAMSQIINDRDNDGSSDKPPERPPGVKNKMGNVPGGRRHNYENTESPGPGFAKDIEQQQDTVLRYTKDPTVQKKKLEELEKNRESTESVYENNTMVQLNRRFDLSKKSAEDIQKAIEDQELNQLPKAPALPKPVKTKAGIVKRLSQRVSKKLSSKKKAKPKEPEPEAEDYIDMSHNEQGLEDYENTAFPSARNSSSQNQPTSDGGGTQSTGNQPRSPDQVDGATRKTGNQTGEQENQEGSDLEDYENLGNVNSGAEEDYENTTFGEKKPAKQAVEEEDYENTLVRNQKPVQQDVDEEDYENFGKITEEESPYMNVAFKP